MKADFCQLWLTCASQAEATKIADTLLVKHLIACARHWPVESRFNWHGKIEESQEILLIMESRLDLFEEIDKAVARLHSYDTYVLEATAIDAISGNAQTWLKEETNV